MLQGSCLCTCHAMHWVPMDLVTNQEPCQVLSHVPSDGIGMESWVMGVANTVTDT